SAYRHLCAHRMPLLICCSLFCFTDPPTTEIYTLSLHDALPIWRRSARARVGRGGVGHRDRGGRRRRVAPQCPRGRGRRRPPRSRSEEHTSELQSRRDLVCRLLLEKKKKRNKYKKRDKRPRRECE